MPEPRPAAGPRFAEERRRGIVTIVNRRGRVKVTELAAILGVTEPTIRRDISLLDSQGELRRTHGGALALRPAHEPEVLSRVKVNAPAKRTIAAACLELVRDGDSVYLDAGTSVLAVAEQLRQRQIGDAAGDDTALRNLNTITNAFAIAQVLAELPGVHGSVLGGRYRPVAGSLVGSLALAAARQFTVNIAFIGVTGLVDGQFTVADLSEADLKRTVMSQSRRIVVPMDSSKVGAGDFVSLCSIDDIDTIVTDRADEYLAGLCRDHDIELVVAGTLPDAPGGQ